MKTLESPKIASTSPEIVEIEETIEHTVEQQIKAYFGDTHPLVYVSYCESTWRQFNDDGTVLRGIENKSDTGAWQINTYYHLEDSIKLGYDIFTLEGNMKYAEHLYNTQGLKPWIWSKPCWSKLLGNP